MKESESYQICNVCIMDTSDPEIIFDETGQCNHCKRYEAWYEREMSNPLSLKERESLMVETIKADGLNHDYDCIMGISGGVDSSYLAYYATQELGLRVMAVHVDAGWNSELAVNNIENLVKNLNIDLHTIVIDWGEIRDLQRAFFLSSVPNVDIPQDHAFFAAMYKEAVKFKHKHVLNGGNMSTESILPTYWGYDAMDAIHLKDVHRKYGKVKLKKYPTFGPFEKLIIYPNFYNFQVHRPLEFINYNKQQAKEFLMNNLGWRDYGGKHYESKFTQFTQAHYLPAKFGFDKRRAHLSSLVISNQITREEALLEMNQPLYNEVQLDEDREYVTKKLGFSTSEWQKIMVAAPKTEHDYKNEIKLVGRIETFLRYWRYGMALIKYPFRMLKRAMK